MEKPFVRMFACRLGLKFKYLGKLIHTPFGHFQHFERKSLAFKCVVLDCRNSHVIITNDHTGA